MNKKLLSISLMFFFCLSIQRYSDAQGLIGYNMSNYAGTNGVYLNPSAIADSRHKLYINILSTDIMAYNDYEYYDNNIGILTAIKDTSFKWNDHLLKNRNGKPHNLDFQNETRGPGFMFSWNDKNSISFTTRLRTSIQAFDVPEALITTLETGYQSGQLNLYSGLTADHFKLNVNMFSEWAITYARVIYEKKQHFVKAGITLKHERGLFMFQFVNQHLNFRFAGKDSIAGYDVSAIMNYTSEKYFGITNLTKVDFSKPADRIKQWFFGGNALGKGWGFDLGAQYEYRPKRKYYYSMDCHQQRNPEVNKYKLKLGFALTDIGHISYNNEAVKQVVLHGGTTISSADTVKWGKIDTIKHITSTDNIVQVFSKALGHNLSSTTTPFIAKLPTTMNLQFDYLIRNRLYLSGVYIQSMRKKQDLDGARFTSVLVLTPRYEYKWFEFSLPLVIRPGFATTQVGGTVRVGPAYFGTDNLSGLLGVGNINGLNFYAGFCVPICKKMKTDKDGDKVSDKLDKCPKEKGTCETQGCPDKDGDGIIDKDDKCPDVAGVIKFKGCADRDGDGIEDSLDTCPDEPGTKRLNGCPDKDKDGVADKDDACPDLAGDKKLKGCPDTDHDGIPDNEDRCPDKAGLKEFKGCPDKDKDGVPDIDDLCPDKAGSIATYGCPDTDGDSIPDNLDKCVKVKGPKSNNGCPIKQVTDKEQSVIDNVFSSLEFETAKATILEKSFESLDSLASLLNKNKKYRLMISGYTDNVGSSESNKKLSEDRAAAVKKYLSDKGVEENRLSTYGYGETNPVADNNTEEGRAKNRRVEFDIFK